MRAAKVDANQNRIVMALRAVGATVQSLAEVGKGVPDLLVGFRGELVLLEVKDGAKVPSAQALTPDQVAWHRQWAGCRVEVVNSIDAALIAIGAKRIPEQSEKRNPQTAVTECGPLTKPSKEEQHG